MTDKSEVDLLLESLPPPKSVVLYDGEGRKLKTLTEEDIKNISKEVLDIMLVDVRKYKDFGQSEKVLKGLIDIKKAWWPAAITNKNLNVNLFDEQLSKWYQAEKELREREKKEIIITEVVNENGK